MARSTSGGRSQIDVPPFAVQGRPSCAICKARKREGRRSVRSMPTREVVYQLWTVGAADLPRDLHALHANQPRVGPGCRSTNSGVCISARVSPPSEMRLNRSRVVDSSTTPHAADHADAPCRHVKCRCSHARLLTMQQKHTRNPASSAPSTPHELLPSGCNPFAVAAVSSRPHKQARCGTTRGWRAAPQRRCDRPSVSRHCSAPGDWADGAKWSFPWTTPRRISATSEPVPSHESLPV